VSAAFGLGSAELAAQAAGETGNAGAPGQAEYETWRAAIPDWVCNVPGGEWEDLPDTVKSGFAALAAREPQSAPGPCPGCESLRRQHAETCGEVGMLAGALTEIRDNEHPYGSYARDKARAALGHLHGASPEPQPAPELLSVTQERHPGREVNLITDDERELPDYGPDPQPAPRATAWRLLDEARADRDDYAARLRAADQSWTRLSLERDSLRDLLDEIGVLAANASEDGDPHGLLEEIAMRIAAHGVPGTEPSREHLDAALPVPDQLRHLEES